MGGEVECCVLEREGEMVRVSLNPVLVEGCRGGQGGETEWRKKRKSGAKQAMVSGPLHSAMSEVCHYLLPSPLMSQLLPTGPVVGTVERITPHYLLVAIATLAGTRLAYAVMDTVSGSHRALGVASYPDLRPFRVNWRSSLCLTSTSN